MPRPQSSRKIKSPPPMMGYRPFGIEKCRQDSVKLKYEEFESIKLINYRMMLQEEASAEMNISRPTFTRLYNRALRAVAKAFAEGKCIEIEGGNYSMENEWYRCRRCKKVFEGVEDHPRCAGCISPRCDEIQKINNS